MPLKCSEKSPTFWPSLPGLLFWLIFISFCGLSHAQSNPSNDYAGPYKLGPGLEEEDTAGPSEFNPAPFHFDQGSWNEMRRSVEEGREPGAPPEVVEVSTEAAEPPKPPPGQIRVELPYESSLSVTGRKVIRVEIKNTHVTAERAEELGTAQDTQSFEMEQELQARIQGTVARKTTINVNFDDTKENVRDFSVVYKGDPDEVVQEAAFGDIVLSLPSTEFVNYNKQLFGIRAALKYKRAELLAIGSRTKGNTETKRFTGTTKRQQVFVNDTAYIRRKFYDLTFPNASLVQTAFGSPILPISDAIAETVYIEDTTGLLPVPDIANDFDIAVPTDPVNSTVRIRMRQMSRGVDYSIDRIDGVITFTNPVPEDVRIAINFARADGTQLSSLVAGGVGVLIKDKKPENSTISQEIKRFYSAGARNIIRDNGLGNFILRVLDQNKETEIGPNLTPILTYTGNESDIEMDFEQGIFKIPNRFNTDPNGTDFSDIYDENVNSGAALHATFSLEYNSVVRTYNLRPNIVLQSEVVEVNGRRLARDLDYFIDYDIGIITFFNDDLIRENTVIEVNYEFAPFGGQLGETLVGARGTFDILEAKKGPAGLEMGKWKVGSTVLYNFAAKPTGPPDIRSAPSSLLVTEGDTQVEGLKLPILPFSTNVSYERARSSEDPNLFGKALIDSMEGIKQEDNASLIQESWRISANPIFTDGNGTYNSVVDFRGFELVDSASHIRWDDVEIASFDTTDDSNTRGLQVFYQLNTENTTIPEQVSIVQTLSFAGRDFSDKTTLEVEVEGAGTNGAGVDFIVDFGSFNEDADGDQLLDTEDVALDGILNLGEDTGWQFNGPGPDLTIGTGDDTVSFVGGNNTRLDTEDLNGDQVRATVDFPATFTPLFRLSDGQDGVDPLGNTATQTDLSFTGRRLFRIPLNLDNLSDEEKARLEGVRQVRVTIRNTNGAATSRAGNIIVARLSMVGITWKPAELDPTTAISTMTIKAVNNKDDADSYVFLIGNPAYNELYQSATPSTDAQEQALALEYTLAAESTGTTKNPFGAARDFSRYKELRFFVGRRSQLACVGTDCGIFFLQAGSDTEFQEARINVSDIPLGDWLLVTIKQVDLNNDGNPETWESTDSRVEILRRGNVPDLKQVTQLKAGVINNTATTVSDQIWLNEIHASAPNKRNGNAEKVAFDSSWTNWMSFGGNRRDVDRLFQTPTTQITNQDRIQESVYFNVDRLSFLPMTFKADRDRTTTPNAFQSNQNALVSFLDEGFVENNRTASTAKLIVPKLPIFDFAYNTNKNENNVTQRTEDTRDWRLGATYSPTIKPDLIPGKRFAFRPVPNSITVSHSRKESKLLFPDAQTLTRFGISSAAFSSSNLTQFSDDSEVRLAFNPWDGFSFNPTYKLKVDKEKREFRSDELTSAPQVTSINGLETPRSLSQNISASGRLRIFKWLEPNYSYSVNGTETNGLPTLNDTTGYTRKSITRNSQGEVSANIQIQRIGATSGKGNSGNPLGQLFSLAGSPFRFIAKSKLLQSMNINASYKIENGDSYENIPEGDNRWRSRLWVGTPLDISTGTSAQRTNLTDRRSFRTNVSWLPFSAYQISKPRAKPLSTLSITNNFFTSTEDSETTGTSKRVESLTFPDLIVTINDTEDFFAIKKVLDDSRLVLKTNTRKVETIAVSKSLDESYGTDYQFRFLRKLDFSTSYNFAKRREDNLLLNQLTSLSETKSYSIQTRIPWGSWSYTPRYERSETDARDSAKATNDLRNDIVSLQIYGDINRPFGLRLGRREIGFANRLILNSTIKWDRKRSDINPQTNFLDVYSGTVSGDYTISKNFRLAVGGSYSQEEHHPDFDKLDKREFAINSTLTIQF